MVNRPEQPPVWLRPEARRAFGTDPENYDRARPEYPERVYDLLGSRVG